MIKDFTEFIRLPDLLARDRVVCCSLMVSISTLEQPGMTIDLTPCEYQTGFCCALMRSTVQDGGLNLAGGNPAMLCALYPTEPAVLALAAFWARWKQNTMNPGTRRQRDTLLRQECSTGPMTLNQRKKFLRSKGLLYHQKLYRKEKLVYTYNAGALYEPIPDKELAHLKTLVKLLKAKFGPGQAGQAGQKDQKGSMEPAILADLKRMMEHAYES